MCAMKMNEQDAALPSEMPEEAGEKRKSVRSEAWEWVKSIAVALIIVFVVHTFVFNLSTVKGNSMQPTLEDGEWLFINKIGFVLGEPERGGYRHSERSGRVPRFSRISRQTRCRAARRDGGGRAGGILYVNGREVVEPYTDSPIMDGDFGPVTVPDGHYFVWATTGIMRQHRQPDVPGRAGELIKGKAQFVLWPLQPDRRPVRRNAGGSAVKEVTIYTDGACSGNPGPGGWGAILMYGAHRKELSGGEKMTTNNRMELVPSSTRCGLETAVHGDGAQRLRLCGERLREGWVDGWLKNGWVNSKGSRWKTRTCGKCC